MRHTRRNTKNDNRLVLWSSTRPMIHICWIKMDKGVFNGLSHPLISNLDRSVGSAVRLGTVSGDVAYPSVKSDHHNTQVDRTNINW